ncbi:MAG: M48 family metallopeptidase, partial [Xanthomonadales bacterium]|nr:M48 family metallopeptidase [Xanthomonadales bacterium]
RDMRRRRLRNVVEEIALASGVPVPEIYVLEEESGINAFAAGYTPNDAAVAVTRGALEKLKRDELQGVIAHEFSHILNGDMRINIRLMGALFGILVLALIGRRVLLHSRFAGSSRSKDGAPLILIALAVTAVGYIGLFFGRWIKAAVSRQREYLADASAVQFTRDPQGIGGALKKIAVYSDGSYLRADSEEVSHMLFGDGSRMMMFATHPPIVDRIRRIEPGFRKEDLDVLAARIMREQVREEEEAAKRAEAAATRSQARGGAFDLRAIIEDIGHPEMERILMAAALAAGLPQNVRDAAHSTEWAPEVIFYTLLDADDDIREAQLLAVARNMGSESETQVRGLLAASGPIKPEQRLPVVEMAFPALKRRPPEFVEKVLFTIEAISQADDRIDVFEYLLARLIQRDLWESANPHIARNAGNKSLKACRGEALVVLSVLARHGHTDAESARAAFQAGVAVLGIEGGDPDQYGRHNWAMALDDSLPLLDQLKAREKERLVQALLTTALHDSELKPAELELLRVVCELIHVPLPILTTN